MVDTGRLGAVRHPEGTFLRADLETFVPERQWDVVVLAEVLYYLRDPIGQFRRYSGFVAQGGAAVVSMYVNPKRTTLRRMLAGLLDWRYPTSPIACVRRLDRHICHGRDVSMRMVAFWRVWVVGV